MSDPAEDSLLTRRTLLSRLRNLDDQESWRTFFNLYWRLLYNVARKSGLDDGGAQEIVQDTVIAVARKMPEFRYDPARGTFRQWLLRITRRRIIDHLRLIRAVVVKACADLSNPVWTPLQTNTLTGAPLYFADPHWTTYESRFYRLHWP